MARQWLDWLDDGTAAVRRRPLARFRRLSSSHERSPRAEAGVSGRVSRESADEVDQLLGGIPEQLVALRAVYDELRVAVARVGRRQRCRGGVDVRRGVHGV